ncbi:hypothetical protein [Acinetobacter sp. YH12041]|uniref:hypothetical protein n=1 Tax=Acinetobacter TaxID=469 RepID=UPI0015D221ED|nr:hypothetical protein [Acinetobacter sp. YH12041]
MLFYVGGHLNGQEVSFEDSCNKRVGKPFGPRTGISRPVEYYSRKQINHNGTIKSFYILDGINPQEHREQILQIWNSVDTDVYAI